ncbi:MAG: ECF-type sigma factor [Pirellulales bacterium]
MSAATFSRRPPRGCDGFSSIKRGRKRTLRRGHSAKRIALSQIQPAVVEQDKDLLALDEALNRLEQLDPRKAELVKLRYFAGLSIPQAVNALNISVTAANRYWAYARAWLHEELRSDPPAACG